MSRIWFFVIASRRRAIQIRRVGPLDRHVASLLAMTIICVTTNESLLRMEG
jgi:hypothetical protein